MIEGWDKECQRIRKSGKHTKDGDEKDVYKIVKQLTDNNALQEKPGRKLNSFPKCKASLIENLDVQSLFKWINEHKKQVLLKKVARSEECPLGGKVELFDFFNACTCAVDI